MEEKEAKDRIKAHFNKWALDDEDLEALQTLFPELAESEDEKIRKEIVECIETLIKQPGASPRLCDWLAYLKKQKELKPNIELIQQSWYMEGYHDRKFGMEPKWIIKTGESGPKHEINPKYGQPLADEQKPTEEQLHNLNEAIKGLRMDGCEHMADSLHSLYNILRRNKEHKPILEVFGFKVGNAVRLKDGDGRKHIIKSFEEVEGVHRPNFYHVEFEDDSARDSIYPGKEYPNCYYTQMEKFEEKQKTEWSKEDKQNLELVIDCIYRFYPDPVIKYKLKDWLKSLHPQPNTVSIKDATKFGNLEYECGVKDGIQHAKNNHWKPSEEQMEALKECGECKLCIKELYEQLKKLKEN